MKALTRIDDPARRAGLPAGAHSEIDAPDECFARLLQEWRQRTAEQCDRNDVALRWNVAPECRDLRLSGSDLLHVAGVLYQLVTDSIQGGRSRDVIISFRCHCNKLTLVVEDDGGHPGRATVGPHPPDGNVEYLAAQAMGAIRRRNRGHRRAAIFWLRPNNEFGAPG